MQKKILIVDDDPGVLKAVTSLLEVFGYETITATGGREAYRILSERNDVAFVISDMRMPDGDGMDLLKNLSAAGIKLPFLLLSGFADVAVEEAIKHGAVGVMSKPFDTNKLIDMIETSTRP